MGGKTLVVAPSWIGDAVLSHPLVVRLKQARPGSPIDVIAPPWVLPIYRRMPEVSHAIAHPFGHGQLRLAERRRYARTLTGYDHAVVLPNTFKSALIPFHAGIARRTGWRGEMRVGLLNDRRRLDKAALPLIVERYAALAQPAHEPLRRPLPEPRLAVDAAARAAAVARLGLATDRPILALAPGAEYGPAKRWPVRHFAALGREYVAAGYAVWLFGSPKDADVTAAIREQVGEGAADLAGRTSLEEAIDLLSLAARVASNDSGLMHVAAALDRPMAAVFGSSSPEFTPPLSAKATVISLRLACSPCFERTCPLGHTDCLERLGPERVRAAIPP